MGPDASRVSYLMECVRYVHTYARVANLHTGVVLRYSIRIPTSSQGSSFW